MAACLEKINLTLTTYYKAWQFIKRQNSPDQIAKVQNEKLQKLGETDRAACSSFHGENITRRNTRVQHPTWKRDRPGRTPEGPVEGRFSGTIFLRRIPCQ